MSQVSLFHATTIPAVKKDGHTAVAGDGQVTMGNAVIMKNTARKVRRLYTAASLPDLQALSRMPLPSSINSRRASLTAMAISSVQPSNLPRSGVATACCRSSKPFSS